MERGHMCDPLEFSCVCQGHRSSLLLEVSKPPPFPRLPFPPWHSEIASCVLTAVYRAEEFVFYEIAQLSASFHWSRSSSCSYKIRIPALQIRAPLPYCRQGWFQAWAKLLAAKGRSLPGATSSLVCLAGRGGDGCGCSRHDPTVQPFPSKLPAV